MISSIRDFIQSRRFAVFLTGVGVTFVMLCLYVVHPKIMQQTDFKVYDTMLPLQKRETVSPVPVVIDIDEASLKAYGQWPWPRYLVARLLSRLSEKGMAMAGVDIILAEPDRTSPERIQNDLMRDTGIHITFGGLPPRFQNYDRLLAEVLADYPAVLALYAHFGGKVNPDTDLPPSVGMISRAKPNAPPLEETLLQASGATLPLPVFWDKAPVAMINISPDNDGIIRRIPLLVSLDDSVYASLSLRVLMAAMGTTSLQARLGPDGLESLRLGSLTIPVTPDGTMIIPFQGGKKTYPYISAKDVLENRLPEGALEGKIGFVGTSAPGLLDIRATPFDRVYPGVEIHAATLDAILSQHFIDIPPWTPGVQVLCIVLAGMMATFCFGFARPVVYVPGGFLLVGAAVGSSVYLFSKGMFVSPFYVVLTVIAEGGILLLLRFFQEERQKLVLHRAFSRYVAPEVVKRITRMKGDILSGEEKEVTILFTDIRGFTSISEKLDPQQVVQLLNLYFTPMTALVRNNEGTLDKFIGDALMAFWNAPVDVANHPVKALTAVLIMLENLVSLNEELLKTFGVTINMGAGLHTGSVYVGNMGSEELLNYTLIGDNVNLTARLESLCPQYGVNIIVSAETAQACAGHFAFQVLDTVRVKGKQRAVSIYTPMRNDEWLVRSDEMLAWRAAYESYMAGRFADAHEGFSSLKAQYGNALYGIYMERTGYLLANAPVAWDGVWTYRSK